LWVKYFTSSPKIKSLITEYGADSFEFEIRKIFKTPERATAWEAKVLKRMKVLENRKWINANIAGHIMPTAESNKKISDFHKGKPKSAEHRRKISESVTGTTKPPRHEWLQNRPAELIIALITALQKDKLTCWNLIKDPDIRKQKAFEHEMGRCQLMVDRLQKI